MPLDAQTVRRIAKLARIGVGEDDLLPIGHELDGIIGWIEQLGEVDVEGVEPMVGTGLARPRLRADRVTDGDRRDDVLANAPDRIGAYFTVPKVVE